MEGVRLELSPEKYDKAVNGGLDDLPVLSEGGDVAVYVKPRATVQGNAGAVITFTVELPDGTMARAQATVTVALLETLSRCIAGWKAGGHL